MNTPTFDPAIVPGLSALAQSLVMSSSSRDEFCSAMGAAASQLTDTPTRELFAAVADHIQLDTQPPPMTERQERGMRALGGATSNEILLAMMTAREWTSELAQSL